MNNHYIGELVNSKRSGRTRHMFLNDYKNECTQEHEKQG